MTRLKLVTLVAIAALGCGSDDLLGVSAPDTPAQVKLRSISAAGGQVTEITIRVDSATARYDYFRCEHGVSEQCRETDHRTGDVAPGLLANLFETAQTKEFRDLSVEYKNNSDVVPPDGGSSTLTVVAGERQKEIVWDKHVTVPEVLQRYVCWMFSVTGELRLCA